MTRALSSHGTNNLENGAYWCNGASPAPLPRAGVVGDAPDPGTLAVVGAAAMLAGTGRVKLFLTVVLIETTGERPLPSSCSVSPRLPLVVAY